MYRKDLVKKDGSDAFLLDAYVRSWLHAAPLLLRSTVHMSLRFMSLMNVRVQQLHARSICIVFLVLQGAYEVSNDVYFSSSRLALLDRGFVFGIAHVRGGGDLGRLW